MPAEGALRDGNGTGFDLIETLRWEPGSGFLRLERHLARLYASAGELGFLYDVETIGKTLGEAVAGSAIAQRVRLVLSHGGAVTVAAQPYEPLPADEIWTLRIARTRLASTDSLLRHKTSRRALYQQARSEFLVHQADEIVLLNERGEICEGTITTLFVDRGDGVLLTPPLQCGLLAGVLRGELLDRGKAREAILRPDDLFAPNTLTVGNSLRGLIPATLSS